MRGLHIREPVPTTVGRIGPGIDTRGDDGYVVVPPSIHQTGHRYAFLGDPWAPIEPAPAWLIIAARTKPVKLITERALAADPGAAPCRRLRPRRSASRNRCTRFHTARPP